MRGPLILTTISRVVTIPFFLLCAVASSLSLQQRYLHLFEYQTSYVADLVMLALVTWSLFLLSVLLAVLFFSRRRMFQPLMTYFSLLILGLFVAMIVHSMRFPSLSQTHHSDPFSATVWTLGLISTVVVWPFYYGFSPRVKRMFTR